MLFTRDDACEDSATARLAAPERQYANGVLAEMSPGSRLVFVGGQIGWNARQEFETDDFAGQVRRPCATSPT